MQTFNVIIYDINSNEFKPYDIMPYLVRVYKESKDKPQTFSEFKEFVDRKSRYMFWARCEYEIILRDCPTSKVQKKIDVYWQIQMNLDIISRLLMIEINVNSLYMANICSNKFYAYSNNHNNIEYITKFFEKWNCYGNAEIINSELDIDIDFNSKWSFPEEEMNKLFESIPDKDNIYMRCLSVEYGCDYVAYWKCVDKTGWYQCT